MLTTFANGAVVGQVFGDSAPQVVWLHGWARTSEDFAIPARALRDEGVSSVALDLPGFGASPALAEACGAHGYSEIVAPLLRECDSRGVVLVGHSFGGRVAIALAAQQPASVRSLVLSAAPLVRVGAAAQPPLRYRAARRLHRWGVLRDGRMEQLRQRYGSADYRAASGVQRGVLVASVTENYDDDLARWRGPTTLVWGDADADVPLSVARAIESALSGPTTLVVLPGVGHLTPTAAPLTFVDVVRGALS